MYYRVIVDGKGIYEYIDGPRLDLKHTDAASWWTEEGWKEYTESGLRGWHSMVVGNRETVLERKELTDTIIYQDQYQVLTRSEAKSR